MASRRLEQAPLNLVTPRSRCPHCGHAIAWYENIPVLSWLALRGRCSPATPISARYPLVELATARCLPGAPGAGASRQRRLPGAASRPRWWRWP
jgi:prepilin signal peptidase PulO-like enzyme (type II secretory pathway)